MINILLCIDDIHPENGYGFNDEYEFNLKKLIDYGIKPTLFVVPVWNFDPENALHKHISWVKSFGDGVEWAIHGYAHRNPDTNRNVWQEFRDINQKETVELIEMARLEIKRATGIEPVGIRYPGWVISEDNLRAVIKNCSFLEYQALHNFGTEVLNFGDLTILPITKEIHKLDELNNYHDNVNYILHAHISPGENKTNMNALNNKNTEAIIKFIDKLKDKYDITFKTASELVRENIQ